MIRVITIVVIIAAILIGLISNVYAETLTKSDDNTDLYIRESREYINDSNVDFNNNHYDDKAASAYINDIINAFFEEFKRNIFNLISLIVICISYSVFNVYIKDGSISEIFRCITYVVCSSVIIDIFKNVINVVYSATNTLFDYMNFSIPIYTTALASGGFAETSASVQSIFYVISNFITGVINKIVYPILYCCGLLTIIGNISNTFKISGIISVISKITRYIIGLIMTVFAGILAFTGFSGINNDNLALKTARYALGNFVPVVGGCLSESLNSLLYSSAITKNSLGNIGFFTLLAICLSPIVKSYANIFIIRLTSAVISVFGESSASESLNSLCDVLTTATAMLILVSIMFVLIITIISMA